MEEEGDGGLEELLTEFNSGRYQYGLTGIQSEGKGVKVLIHFLIEKSAFFFISATLNCLAR